MTIRDYSDPVDMEQDTHQAFEYKYNFMRVSEERLRLIMRDGACFLNDERDMAEKELDRRIRLER